MNITCIWDGHNTLGECPIWDVRDQALYWVDIEKADIHKLEPKTSKHQSWPIPSKLGSIALHQDGGLVAALRKGFAHIRLPSGEIAYYDQPIADRDDLKFNDGACDRQGKFWAGTADVKEQEPLGSLYRLNPDGHAEAMDHGFIVSNGIAWSPDNRIMYFADSGARTIFQYEFNPQNSTISNRKIFITLSLQDGYPDGLTVDSEGYIWCAHWDGWRVTRFAPNSEIDCVFNMPVQRPTSCCFGGPDLNILYVTSASRDLTVDELSLGPQAGGVFAIETNFKGLPEPLFLGSQV